MFPTIYTSPISPSDVPGYLETLSERLKGFLPTFIFALIIFFIGYIIAKIIISIVGKGLKKSRLDESAHGFIKTLIQIMLYVMQRSIFLKFFQLMVLKILIKIINLLRVVKNILINY